MLHEYSIRASGTCGQETIAISQRSEGQHPFVAWHGITAVNRFWFWDVLWPRGAVYLTGLPGHGPIGPLPPGQAESWTPEHFIDCGVDTLRQLAEGRPATIIGHSTGGMIALGIAQKAPELVARLILISPVVWHDLRGIVWLWQRCAFSPALLRQVVRASLGAGRASYLAFMGALNAFIADRRGFYGNWKISRTVAHGYEHMRSTPLEGIAGTTRVLCQADMRPIVGQNPTSIPTLIIHGDRDPIIPLAQSRWLAQRLPNAELHVAHRAGHLPYAEQEDSINAAVARWLDAHPLA
ncbi:alpha/beta hydrolase [Chloroflexia bacterium SDU3-3]|nr:alpha/beta hydrolase [Chloroflexia bacterium SDU3-3]